VFHFFPYTKKSHLSPQQNHQVLPLRMFIAGDVVLMLSMSNFVCNFAA